MASSSPFSSEQNRPAVFTPEAAWVCSTLEQAGYEAYAVGGCVRDWLMGRTPKDVDVVTNASPEQVQAVFPDVYQTGNDFLVSRVRYGKEEIEIATFRKDIYPYGGSSKPVSVMQVATLAEDLLRRDFTMNAIAMDLRGNLHDPLHGLQDVQNRLLRETHPLACREDPVRILRGCKLVSRYGLNVEAGTLEHMRENADGLKNVAIERNAKELLDTLTAPFADEALLLWRRLGILSLILPSTKYVTDQEWNQTAKQIKRLPADPVSLRLAMLARLISHEIELFSAFGVPKREWKNILFLSTHMELSFSPEDPKSVKNWLNELNLSGWQEFLPLLKQLAVLARAKADPLSRSDEDQGESKSRVEEKLESIRKLCPNYPLGVKDLPFTGEELVRRGLKGKEVGRVLLQAVQWMRTFGNKNWDKFWEEIS